MTHYDDEDDDKSYFYRRAEQELEQAQQSTCGPAVQAHYAMAERYLELCAGDDAPGDQVGA